MSKISKQSANIFHQVADFIVTNTEQFFYKLGVKIGTGPKLTILLCWLLVLVGCLGFLRFYQEKHPLRLWVPQDTEFIRDSEWLMNTYERGYRLQVIMFQSDNVLTPQLLLELGQIHEAVKTAKARNNATWNDVCFKIPKVDKKMLSFLEGNSKNDIDPSLEMNAALYCSFVESMKTECLEKSILELWNFNLTRISLLSQNDVLYEINAFSNDPVYGEFKNYLDLLGDIERNSSGHIVGAKALHNIWMVNVNFSAVDMDKVGNMAGTADWVSEEAHEWELEFLNIMENFSRHVRHNFSYTSGRSFGDLSNATMFQDINKLIVGVFIMVIYVQFVISKFNCLEARIALGCVGLLSIGMAFIAGVGICSLFGIFYGPVHTSLPFLLMGLGVDDMFVIMCCWEELTYDEKKQPLPERIGFMLKHAGVSITITSVTDVIAFLIGSYTILPSLESFCLYAAVCVFLTYIFAVTFFSACLVLDQRRLEAQRNGIVPCYKHDNYVIPECSQKQLTNKVFEFIYSNIIFTTPGKITVVLTTLVCFGFATESMLKLEQRFDPHWFVPKGSHFEKYIVMRKLYFPNHGFEAGMYLGAINYTHELKNIKSLIDNLENTENITNNVHSWVYPFRKFVLTNFKDDVFVEVLSDDRFNLYLSKFLFSPRYARYQANFRFEEPLECGIPTSKILMSSIDFNFFQFTGPEQYIPAMHLVQNLAKHANFTTGDKFATAWSKVFSSWTTDEVIDIEVKRNLQLALVCVMGCTIILIAEWQTCCWIFLCVLLTMVNVCGFMQRWNLTIDIVSCIGLELGIGLCVDYAAHVGHTFLTVHGGTRQERSLKTVQSIGSAVLYGGLSTLIGVSMLSISDAYIFQSFFKIFLLVIIFGLFHGIALLPVIYTWIGPPPYRVHQRVPSKNDINLN